MNFNYQMRFSKTGRARFIAHLDTLSCLVRAVRRSGFELAFTEGMRPKPILSLAMPLGVGVESENEICDFSLRQRAPLTELAKGLGQQLPEGLELISVGPSYDRSKAASRVDGVTYRIELHSLEESLADAAEKYNQVASFVLIRKRPKGDKEVDIKQFIKAVDIEEQGKGIIFDMKVTSDGTGRPDEIITALGSLSGQPLNTAKIVRTSISLQEERPAQPARRGRPAPRHRPR